MAQKFGSSGYRVEYLKNVSFVGWVEQSETEQSWALCWVLYLNPTYEFHTQYGRAEIL